jgi:hypothetical protein
LFDEQLAFRDPQLRLSGTVRTTVRVKRAPRRAKR